MLLIIINTARGELIKDLTIVKNLKNKKILCYGADVLENEPISFQSKIYNLIKNKKFRSKVILTPHSAFYTKESFYDLRFKAAKTILSFLKNKSFPQYSCLLTIQSSYPQPLSTLFMSKGPQGIFFVLLIKVIPLCYYNLNFNFFFI